MSDFIQKEVIDCQLADVFETVADPKNAAKIFLNVEEVEAQNEKERQVGASYREYRQLTNRRVGTDIEITCYDRNQAYCFKSLSKGLHVEYCYTFSEAEDGKTNVRFEGTVYPEKWILKLAKPLLVKMLKKEDQNHLTYVKRYMEGTE
ncbi:SRPBCC family protein [Salipaludibacillus sp. HK11]|uniref:SRPBCC family protein n=1 Tax=Salipaludibacillus sp. HK11 TaxID=3394320 RepID=UPI0039FD0F90